jgi:hypothetical protein
MKRLTYLIAVFGIVSLLGAGFAGEQGVVYAQGVATPAVVDAHVWFHEDFATHANRWRLFDLGKASAAFDSGTLVLRAQPANYALWTIPDTDLKLDRYAIKVQMNLRSGGSDARAGVIIGYQSENDMLVLAVSRQGTVYLGHYYFGIWNDVIPPSQIDLDPDQPVTLEARSNAGHVLRLFVNGQAAGQTTLQNFQASGFGLYALTGKVGGIDAAFLSFVVEDSQ